LERRRAAAAADVEDALAGARRQRGERGAAERRELPVEPLLLRDPRVPGSAVPVLDLLLVHRQVGCHPRAFWSRSGRGARPGATSVDVLDKLGPICQNCRVGKTPSSTPDRRAGLLEAALGNFVRFGFRKTSMDDVARDAGISRQALYAHFADKEELFREAMRYGLDVA